MERIFKLYDLAKESITILLVLSYTIILTINHQ
jgi:hypothetical protein